MFEFMEPLYDLIDFPTDQTKFIISQVFALVFGMAMRRYVKATPENALTRHVLSTLLGFLIGFYCFDTDFYHLLVVSLVSYVFLRFLPRAYVHLITFVFVLIYLSSIHLYTQLFHYGLKQFDVTAPMMIFLQKLSYITFSYNDGIKPTEKLTPWQKANVLNKMPSIAEFFGYLFHFQGVAIGPGCTFKDYIEFMNGDNFRKHKINNNQVDIKCDNNKNNSDDEPSVKKTLLRKLLYIGIMFYLFINVSLKYPVELNMSPEILKKPVWYRLSHLHLSGFGQRLYYYIAWTIGDFVNNASGFGFNGYDEFGQPKWDLLLNIRILGIEKSTSIKMTIDNWHIQSSNWLRRIAFERLPACKTLGVFFLSAFWHGFYPGYYFTLILSALLVYIGRGIRRNIRPLFLKNKYTSILYSLTGWCCVQFTVNYVLISFFYLSIKRSVQFYNSWFWIVHLFVVFCFFVLPRDSFKSRPVKKD